MRVTKINSTFIDSMFGDSISVDSELKCYKFIYNDKFSAKDYFVNLGYTFMTIRHETGFWFIDNDEKVIKNVRLDDVAPFKSGETYIFIYYYCEDDSVIPRITFARLDDFKEYYKHLIDNI